MALPELSLKTNLDGCEFDRGGDMDMERAEAVAGKKAAQPRENSVRGRTFFILGVPSIMQFVRLTSGFSAKIL